MRTILFVLLLTSCASTQTYWEKPGATQQEFFQDRGQCQAQAFSSVSGPLSVQSAMVFNACMAGKGWYTVER